MPAPPPPPGSLCRATILPTKDGRGVVLIVSRHGEEPNFMEPHLTVASAARRLLDLFGATT